MKSPYKNATENEILKKLLTLKKENFPFHQPVLQGDTFWIYCNSRRYWGSYKKALNKAKIKLKNNEIKSEFGHKIDWWELQESQNQREWLGIVLKCLYGKFVDISAKGLKDSPYFDLYTDAVTLFGKYESALEYAEIPSILAKRIDYPKNEAIFHPIIEMYCCDNHDKRCELLKLIDSNLEERVVTTYQDTVECPIIVDGANVAYIGGKPSLENIKLIDRYLQEIGFRKDNINFIFDAAFRFRVDEKEFDALIKGDYRFCIAPAGEQADAHILTVAQELFKKDPKFPPIVITNDQFSEYFQKHPKLEKLKGRKRGVTWTFILKEPKPLINLLGLEV
jgi:hypothetical protein